MDNQGFIIFHRKVTDHPIFKSAGLFRLFFYLVCKANHQENRFLFNGEEVVVKRGQLITGRLALSKALREKPSTIRNWCQTLSKSGIVDIKSNNKFSLITIIKYSQYQSNQVSTDNKKDNQRTTKGQQKDTNNNDNNVTKNTAEATPTAEESFNQKEYIKSLLDSKQKHLNIIGLYFEQKQLTLPNKIAIQAEVRRNVRPATSLVGWDSKAIINTMAWLESQKLTWGLEAVVKNIARVNS